MRDNRELNALTAVIAGICAVGVASSMSPPVEHIANVVVGFVVGLLVLGVLGYIGREVRRELLFRAEMRAFDRRDAARAASTEQTGSPMGGDRR